MSWFLLISVWESYQVSIIYHTRHVALSARFIATLSICTASPHRQIKHQRPRSSTAPGVHFDLPGDPTSGWAGKRVKVRPRSHSAILARTVNTEHLMKLLSVSKQTGFLPQEEISDPTAPNSFVPERQISSVKQSTTAVGESSHSPEKQQKILPLVVRNEELVMKIEVRGLQKHDELRAEGGGIQTSPEKQSAGFSNVSPRVYSPRSLLPPISKGASISSKKQPSNHQQPKNDSLKTLDSVTSPNSEKKGEEKVAETQETSHKYYSDSNNTANKNVSPSKVSVVSIGERPTGDDERPKSKKTKQRRSSGRLSLGWSPPQTIEPISGSPLNIPFRQQASMGKKGNKSQEKETGMTDREARPLSSSMRININVNDFLADIDTVS